MSSVVGNAGNPADIYLQVYDVTSAESQFVNNSILRFNKLFGGIGGVYHGAIQVGINEWSYGYCPYGTGVFGCRATKNPYYTYRTKIYLGQTKLSTDEVGAVLKFLKRQWPGCKYDLITCNCCHFCQALVQELGVGPLPGWLNRLAEGADWTVNTTHTMIERMNTARERLSTTWTNNVARPISARVANTHIPLPSSSSTTPVSSFTTRGHVSDSVTATPTSRAPYVDQESPNTSVWTQFQSAVAGLTASARQPAMPPKFGFAKQPVVSFGGTSVEAEGPQSTGNDGQMLESELQEFVARCATEQVVGDNGSKELGFQRTFSRTIVQEHEFPLTGQYWHGENEGRLVFGDDVGNGNGQGGGLERDACLAGDQNGGLAADEAVSSGGRHVGSEDGKAGSAVEESPDLISLDELLGEVNGGAEAVQDRTGSAQKGIVSSSQWEFSSLSSNQVLATTPASQTIGNTLVASHDLAAKVGGSQSGASSLLYQLVTAGEQQDRNGPGEHT